MDRNSFERSYDITRVLDEEGIDYTQNGTHVFLDECPFCSKKHKLCIDKRNKFWICYYCADSDLSSEQPFKGNMWTLLRDVVELDRDDINRIYNNEETLTYLDDILNEKQKEDIRNKLTEYTIPKWLTPLNRTEESIKQFPEAYQYLWRRFIRTPEQYDKFQIHYDKFKKRVVFPIITRNQICVGTQSRDITGRFKTNHPKCTNHLCSLRFKYYFCGEEQAPYSCPECGEVLQAQNYPKSLNTANIPKTELFFNEQNINWEKPIVLVEGPFDAINVYNAMAFLGKTLSQTQMSILIEHAKAPIILYLDGDQAGDKSTESIYNQLFGSFEIKIVYSTDNDDPGSHDLRDNQRRVDQALEPYKWFELKGL